MQPVFVSTAHPPRPSRRPNRPHHGVITITGIGDHLRPEWPITITGTRKPWSLTSLREKLIKIGAKVVSHGRYVTFQMAEVAVPRQMFKDILMLIARLRAPPAPA